VAPLVVAPWRVQLRWNDGPADFGRVAHGFHGQNRLLRFEVVLLTQGGSVVDVVAPVNKKLSLDDVMHAQAFLTAAYDTAVSIPLQGRLSKAISVEQYVHARIITLLFLR